MTTNEPQGIPLRGRVCFILCVIPLLLTGCNNNQTKDFGLIVHISKGSDLGNVYGDLALYEKLGFAFSEQDCTFSLIVSDVRYSRITADGLPTLKGGNIITTTSRDYRSTRFRYLLVVHNLHTRLIKGPRYGAGPFQSYYDPGDPDSDPGPSLGIELEGILTIESGQGDVVRKRKVAWHPDFPERYTEDHYYRYSNTGDMNRGEYFLNSHEDSWGDTAVLNNLDDDAVVCQG